MKASLPIIQVCDAAAIVALSLFIWSGIEHMENIMKFGKFAAKSATAVLLLGAAPAFAQNVTSESYSGSVAGALQGDTGFLTGGQVQVNGVGQGSLVLSRGQANIDVQTGTFGGTDGVGPGSQSSFLTTLDFDRDVNAGAALVGIGTVVAQGESLAGSGVVGTSNSSASVAGVGTFDDDNDAETAEVDFAASATTTSSATGGLVGSLSTSNTIQMLGSGSLFAGSQALDIGERTQAYSAGVSGVISYDGEGISIEEIGQPFETATDTFTTGDVLATLTQPAGGAGFGIDTALSGEASAIDMNVSNAGNGSILVTGSTGGFFGQGTTFGANGQLDISDVGGFFDQVIP